MSYKHTEDKKKPGYPFTARQKRQATGGRKSRKVGRNKSSKETH